MSVSISKAARHQVNWPIENQPDKRPNPEQIAIANEELEALQRALKAIPRDERVFILLNVQGYRQAEIADVLSYPLGSIGRRLNKARIHLKKKLQELSNAAISRPLQN